MIYDLTFCSTCNKKLKENEGFMINLPQTMQGMFIFCSDDCIEIFKKLDITMLAYGEP